jgi:hypothetical protein
MAADVTWLQRTATIPRKRQAVKLNWRGLFETSHTGLSSWPTGVHSQSGVSGNLSVIALHAPQGFAQGSPPFLCAEIRWGTSSPQFGILDSEISPLFDETRDK